MTEQEAKILASEFEGNRDWQVTGVHRSQILCPGHWHITLKHRHKCAWVCLMSANPDDIQRLLTQDIAVAQTIPYR